MKRWRPESVSGNVLSVLAGLALIAVLIVLPDIAPRPTDGPEVISAFRGRIESLTTSVPDDPETPPVPIARVRILEGARAGELIEALLLAPGGSQVAGTYRAGDEVVVTVTEGPDGTPFIAVSDRWRLPWLQLLGLGFAAAVIAVGGWHGLRALVALGLTIGVILKVLLPLVIIGVAPVPLAVTTAAAVTILTVLLTEGWRRSSLAAILGTTAALALTGLLGAAVTSVMAFTYSAGSDLGFLATQGGQGLDLRGVLLAAFILGAVGVLDDVTVTQATLVEELSTSGGLFGRRLFARAMVVGRSHIAATVNTLFLAYVGAGLPLLVVLIVSQQPSTLVANQEEIATEVARIVVGSIGIIAAVPLTTFIATVLAGHQRGPHAGWEGSRSRAVPVVLGVTAVTALMLIATAVLPLSGPPRDPFEEPVFEPGGSPDAGVSSPAPAPGDTPEPDRGEPVALELGEPMPINLDGVDVGTVAVVDATQGVDDGLGSVPVTVIAQYDAVAEFDVSAGTWALVLDDGTETTLEPGEGPGVLETRLAAGDALTVTLEAGIPTGDSAAFVVFVDRRTSRFIFAVPLP